MAQNKTSSDMAAAAKPKYKIKQGYIGMEAWTIPPAYTRKDGGKFVLDESLSQTDLGYLFEVVKYEGVEVAE